MKALLATILIGLLLPVAVTDSGRDRAATLARAALSAFSAHAPAISASPLGVESVRFLRRQWVEMVPDFWTTVPSPDGGYASEVDWFSSAARGL
jgi:hypothetical protein